jgi:hypothetical protein
LTHIKVGTTNSAPVNSWLVEKSWKLDTLKSQAKKKTFTFFTNLRDCSNVSVSGFDANPPKTNIILESAPDI